MLVRCKMSFKKTTESFADNYAHTHTITYSMVFGFFFLSQYYYQSHSGKNEFCEAYGIT